MNQKADHQAEKDPEALDQEIQEVKAKLNQATDLYKRAVADYHNLEKQAKQESATNAQLASSMLLKKLLPIADKMGEIVSHAPKEERNSNWFKGIEMILRQFQDVFRVKR